MLTALNAAVSGSGEQWSQYNTTEQRNNPGSLQKDGVLLSLSNNLRVLQLTQYFLHLRHLLKSKRTTRFSDSRQIRIPTRIITVS